MFLCLACLLEQRDHIIRSGKDYQDIAMYFDKLVRSHDVTRVLSHARRLFAEYLNEDWTPSPQPASVSQVTQTLVSLLFDPLKSEESKQDLVLALNLNTHM